MYSFIHVLLAALSVQDAGSSALLMRWNTSVPLRWKAAGLSASCAAANPAKPIPRNNSHGVKAFIGTGLSRRARQ